MLETTRSARRWVGIAVATAMLASLIPLAGVAAAAATKLVVTSTPTTTVSGVQVNITVAAEDGTNAIDTGFAGTVHVVSSDGAAILPADHLYTLGEAGVHTFAVTLKSFGSQSVTFSSGGLTDGVATITVTASKLVFSVAPPASRTAGVAFDVTVEAQDANNVVVTTFTGAVAFNSSDTQATVNPTSPYTYVPGDNGSHTFAVTLKTTGTRSVTFSSSGLTSASQNVTVSADVANHLVFTRSPSAGAVGVAFPSQPIVAIEDQFNNIVTTDSTTTVTLSKTAGTPTSGGPGNLTCSGGLTRTASGGQATFSGCSIDAIGVGYRLHAVSSPVLTVADSTAFDIPSGPANKLAFCWGSVASSCSTTAPTSAQAGTAWTVQPTIVVQDASSRTVTADNSTSVTLSIASGTPTSGGPGTLTCSGTGTTMTVSAGVASFSGCAIDKLGTAYRLNATSSPSYTAAQSNAFNVAAGVATKLVFTSQPTSASAGQAFPVQPVVAIADAGGNTSTTSVATITLSLGTNPGSGTLTCTGGNAKATVSGVATFAGCFINNAGNGYTLVATATNVSPAATLTAATSNAFNVTAQTASLTLTTTATVITWGAGVTLTTHFAVLGNAKQFTLQRSSPNHASWSTIATLTADSSGNASLFYRPATNNWYRAVFAGTGDLLAANSNEVRVVVRQIAILRPTNGGNVKNVALNSSRSFVTTVRPARPEIPAAKVSFVFYHKIAGHWTLVTTRNVFINSAGVAQYTFRFGSAGEWYVRSIANPTTANANSVWSPVERYHVG